MRIAIWLDGHGEISYSRIYAEFATPDGKNWIAVRGRSDDEPFCGLRDHYVVREYASFIVDVTVDDADVAASYNVPMGGTIRRVRSETGATYDFASIRDAVREFPDALHIGKWEDLR